MADDEWGEDELKAPKYLCTCIVTKDYIPDFFLLMRLLILSLENNDTLTLILDDLVYVFKKDTGKPGWWEGETKGVYGLFPASHVKEIQETFCKIHS